jgi:hypothetical protein
MQRFRRDGREIVPIGKRSGNVEKVRFVVEHAYCPKGCSIMDIENKINEYPGLRIKFKRPGVEGILVLSAIEGDFEKILVSGELEEGVKDELYCPHCDTPFKKLVSCHCQEEADLVVIGLTPELDFNNAITFCNVTGCDNGTTMSSGEVLRHIRLESY